MAIVAAARTRRAGALFSPAGLVIVVVLLLLLVFASIDFSPTASSSSSGSSNGGSSHAASAAGSSSSAAALIPSYTGVPDFGISVNLPTWALCPQPPCQYSAMADGAVNTSVSRGALRSNMLAASRPGPAATRPDNSAAACPPQVPFSSQFGEDVWLSKYLFHNKVCGLPFSLTLYAPQAPPSATLGPMRNTAYLTNRAGQRLLHRNGRHEWS